MKLSKMLTALSVSPEARAEIALDLLLLIGLSLVGYGFWLFKPWLAFVVVGSVMVLIAVAAAYFKNRGAQRVKHVG